MMSGTHYGPLDINSESSCSQPPGIACNLLTHIQSLSCQLASDFALRLSLPNSQFNSMLGGRIMATHPIWRRAAGTFRPECFAAGHLTRSANPHE
jgi:hypothetical protein